MDSALLHTRHGNRPKDLGVGLPWNGGPLAFGFLSGPVEMLRKACTGRRFILELSDGTKLPATMLQVNDAGMALVSIDPKRSPSMPL